MLQRYDYLRKRLRAISVERYWAFDAIEKYRVGDVVHQAPGAA